MFRQKNINFMRKMFIVYSPFIKIPFFVKTIKQQMNNKKQSSCFKIIVLREHIKNSVVLTSLLSV